MTAHLTAAPVEKSLLTPGTKALLAVGFVGLALMGYRFLFGLGAATNLSNGYPWGVWKAVGVAAGVALATGGFGTAALVHVFHRTRYAALVRPALVIALLGYTFGVFSLLVDLGRYYNIWHPIAPGMWQGNSVLFEVAMCIMAYLTILYLEFIPVVCERFMGRVNLPGWLHLLNRPLDQLLRLLNWSLGRVMTGLLLLGLVLSCMHHSSLGALMLIAPYKMDPIWYTPVLPLLFLLSVLPAGFAMVVAVVIPTAWGLGQRPPMHILTPLSRYILVFLGVYLIARITDVIVRDAVPGLVGDGVAGTSFWLEVGAGIAAPLVLLSFSGVRKAAGGLLTACLLIVAGLVLNRINVFLVAYTSMYGTERYVPSAVELVIMGGLAAFFMLLFRLLVTVFPILPVLEPAKQRAGASSPAVAVAERV